MNKLLGQFGLQFTNLYTDAKLLPLPKGTPTIGGLRWGYYSGNLVLIEARAKRYLGMGLALSAITSIFRGT